MKRRRMNDRDCWKETIKRTKEVESSRVEVVGSVHSTIAAPTYMTL
jgi:hypothetical protein